MIRAVIFDFGQTLVDSADGFRSAEKDAQAKLYKHLGLTRKEDFLSVYRKIRKTLHGQSNFSRRSLFQEVYFYYCLSPDMDLMETWEAEYWQIVKAHTRLFPETESVLKDLNQKYVVGLVTNTQGQKSEGTHRIRLFPNLEKYFSEIIVAGESGIPPKPDPKPFRYCAEKLGVEAFESVYVGDDYRIDICGAQEAGMHTVWIQHHSVKRSWPEVKTSTPIITCLDQLLDIETIVSV
ncbi:MAG: HAD family hydrolase [Deltaproteobacteria bacterium]|nr:HAD family hydrolase [Deltaproteobacteria bacterium]